MLRGWIAFFYLTGLNASEVYDCFTFFNELELLKVRFEELYDSVDHFVLVEATHTFSGEPKPLYFAENKQIFDSYLDKVIHVVVEDLPLPAPGAYPDHWLRQEFQLNASLRGLDQCASNDIIFISDLDEIPNRRAIGQVRDFFANSKKRKNENQLICALQMRLFLFHLNCESPTGWNGAVKAAPYWLMKKRQPWNLKLLHMYDRNLPKIYAAGWHFHSMCGDDKERLAMKLRGIYQYDPAQDFHATEKFPGFEGLSAVEDWRDHTDGFVQWTLAVCGSMVVPIDDSYPKYIRDHIDYFQNLGWLKNSDF